MPTFAELVAKATESPDAIGDISTYVADLQAAHTEELTREVNVRQTRITDLEKENAAKVEENTSLMRTNYGLIMSKPADSGDDKPEPKPPVTGIDSLFKPKDS